jgi:hypothetical protein
MNQYAYRATQLTTMGSFVIPNRLPSPMQGGKGTRAA